MKITAARTALGTVASIPANRGRRWAFRKNRRNIVTGILSVALLSIIYLPEGASIINLFLGSVIVLFASVPFLQWLRHEQWENSVPFFQVFFFSHAVNFGLTAFQGGMVFRGIISIPNFVVTQTLIIILAGMGSLLAGWHLARGVRLKLPFTYHLDERRFVRLLFIYLGLYAFFTLLQRFSIGDMLRSQFGNLFDYMFGGMGLVSIFCLSGYHAEGRLNRRQSQLFWGAIIASLLSGLSSGWLGQAITPVLALVLGRLAKGGHFRRSTILVAVVLVLFLQVGKSAFREMTWQGEMGGVAAQSITDIPLQVSSWFSASALTLENMDEQDRMGSAVVATLGRFNHLEWFAWVVSQTPDSIPYLEGYSYSDLYLFFIPRFFWPDKPTNLEKANYIAVRYGWLDDSQVGQTAVTPGLMDEAFINFGIYGVIIGMAIIGILFRLLSTAMNDPRAGKGWQLALVALLCMKWMPIATAASYFGGFFQPMIMILIMCFPARRKRPFSA